MECINDPDATYSIKELAESIDSTEEIVSQYLHLSSGKMKSIDRKFKNGKNVKEIAIEL
jgi:hypothetical protein